MRVKVGWNGALKGITKIAIHLMPRWNREGNEIFGMEGRISLGYVQNTSNFWEKRKNDNDDWPPISRGWIEVCLVLVFN